MPQPSLCRLIPFKNTLYTDEKYIFLRSSSHSAEISPLKEKNIMNTYSQIKSIVTLSSCNKMIFKTKEVISHLNFWCRPTVIYLRIWENIPSKLSCVFFWIFDCMLNILIKALKNWLKIFLRFFHLCFYFLDLDYF